MEFGKAQGGGLIALGLMLVGLQIYILFSSTQPSGSPTQAPAMPTRGEQITKFVPGVVGLLALAVGGYLDTVNEWIWKKRQEELSWVTIKNILRTMQRVLSCSSKDKKPPFSQEGLAIPERDKLQMKIESREAISFSWLQTKQIAEQVYKLDADHARKERYATVFLVASATGLRCGELFALKLNDIDFKAGTVRVDESADQRTYIIGPCKNAATYRTILLADSEGREVLGILRRFLKGARKSHDLVFQSKRGFSSA